MHPPAYCRNDGMVCANRSHRSMLIVALSSNGHDSQHEHLTGIGPVTSHCTHSHYRREDCASLTKSINVSDDVCGLAVRYFCAMRIWNLWICVHATQRIAGRLIWPRDRTTERRITHTHTKTNRADIYGFAMSGTPAAHADASTLNVSVHQDFWFMSL